MAYTDKVIDHYENPRNVGTLDKERPDVGTGLVGAPACGDVMRLQIRVERRRASSRTPSSRPSAAARPSPPPRSSPSGSRARRVDEALHDQEHRRGEELNLPPVKIHCSVLAEDAIKAAIADFQKKRGARGAPRPREPEQAAAERRPAGRRIEREATWRIEHQPRRPRRASRRSLAEKAHARRRAPRSACRAAAARGSSYVIEWADGAARARQGLRARRRARLRRPEELPCT